MMRSSNRIRRQTHSRRQVLTGGVGATAALVLGSPGRVFAQATPDAAAPDYSGRSMTSTSYGGIVEEMQAAAAFDPFAEQTGGEVTLITLYSADALARVTAEAGNPQIDLVQFSGGQERVAAEEGLTQAIDPGLIPNLDNVDDALRDAEDRWVTIGAIAEGILYRTDMMPTPPTSWQDFWSPDVQRHIAFPDISNGYGMNFLVMAARINGGGEDNIDPGFAALAEIAPDAVIFKTAAEVTQLFSQGDIWMMPYDSANAFQAREMGLPIAFATPTEGAPAIFLTASVVAGGENADMANSLINAFLTEEAQVRAAEDLRYAPVITDIDLPAEVADDLPPVDQLLRLDNEAINAGREAWTERWNREILGA